VAETAPSPWFCRGHSRPCPPCPDLGVLNPDMGRDPYFLANGPIRGQRVLVPHWPHVGYNRPGAVRAIQCATHWGQDQDRGDSVPESSQLCTLAKCGKATTPLFPSREARHYCLFRPHLCLSFPTSAMLACGGREVWPKAQPALQVRFRVRWLFDNSHGDSQLHKVKVRAVMSEPWVGRV
jgi:hypothetical protein